MFEKKYEVSFGLQVNGGCTLFILKIYEPKLNSLHNVQCRLSNTKFNLNIELFWSWGLRTERWTDTTKPLCSHFIYFTQSWLETKISVHKTLQAGDVCFTTILFLILNNRTYNVNSEGTSVTDCQRSRRVCFLIEEQTSVFCNISTRELTQARFYSIEEQIFVFS